MFNRIAYVVREADDEYSLVMINDERFTAKKIVMDGSIDLPFLDDPEEADEYVAAAWDVMWSFGDLEGAEELDYWSGSMIYKNGENGAYDVLAFRGLWFDVVRTDAVRPECGSYDERYMWKIASKCADLRSGETVIEVFVENAQEFRMIGREVRGKNGRWIRRGEWARLRNAVAG